MTDERHDTPPPRPPLDVRTIVIASIASVIGALVVTRLGYAGKIAGAALAPIVVLLVTEFGHRSSAKLEETAEKVAPVVIHPRRRPSTAAGTEEGPTIVLPPAGDPSPPEPSVADPPTLALPGAPVRPGRPGGEPSAGSRTTGRPYTVHSGAPRARATTRRRLAGILLAAACGVVVSIAAFTVLSTASGGHVKLGSAIQNSSSQKKKPKPASTPTSTTSQTTSTTGRTTGSSTSTSSSTSTVTSTVTAATTGSGTTTAPASTPSTASTASGPATTAPPPGSETAPATTSGPPPATTAPTGTAPATGAPTSTGG